LAGDLGPRAAAAALRPETAVVDEPESLNANLFRVLRWPEVLHQYRFARPVEKLDLLAATDSWAFHYLPASPGHRQLAFAFEDPPEGCFGDTRVYRDASAVWGATEEFKGIPTWNLVKPIAVRALYLRARELGLREREDGSLVYFCHFPPA
jgi:hypothetical protein